jgi:transcriptional regulator with XRE-family HTH domain
MKSNILVIFGKRVKEARNSKGWSQNELADKCELHRTYIGSIERNERNVSLINVEKIAQALDVKVSWLIGER